VLKYLPACARSNQRLSLAVPAPLSFPPFSHLVSQLVNKRDDRSEACVRAFGVGVVVVVLAYGIWDSGNPESKSKSQTPQFSFCVAALKFCYAAANLQQLP